MKRFAGMILAILMLVGSTSAQSEILERVPVGGLSIWYDYAKVLSKEDKACLNDIVMDAHKLAGVTFCVITVESLTGEASIAEYATKMFEAWITDDVENADKSVLILFALGEEAIYIAPGTGMRDFFTEEVCKKLIYRVAREKIDAGEYSAAVTELARTATLYMASRINGEYFDIVDRVYEQK